MAFKLKISSADYAKLDDASKALYVADGDNFKLDLDADDDPTAALRARDREKQAAADAKKEADDAKKLAKDLQEKLDASGTDDARKRGDIDALTKSYDDKLLKQKTEFEAKLAKKDQFIVEQLVDNVAGTIANEISTIPALLKPQIAKRLKADLDGDKPVTRILDAEGKPSASTLEDLKTEFINNKDFAPVIVASKASGGGANGDKGNGGAGDTRTWDKWSEEEKTKLYKTNPSEYMRRQAAWKQSKATA